LPPRNPAYEKADLQFNLFVGKNIKALRTNRELSQADLAVKANMDSSHISRIETAERGLSFRQAIVLAQALGVELIKLGTWDFHTDSPSEKGEEPKPKLRVVGK